MLFDYFHKMIPLPAKSGQMYTFKVLCVMAVLKVVFVENFKMVKSIIELVIICVCLLCGSGSVVHWWCLDTRLSILGLLIQIHQ